MFATGQHSMPERSSYRSTSHQQDSLGGQQLRMKEPRTSVGTLGVISDQTHTDNQRQKGGPCARNALEEIKTAFDVHLATSRLAQGHDKTIAWLEDHKIPYSELHWARHGEKHLIDRTFLAAVEDDRERGYAFHSTGVEVFLLAHPWNHIGPFSPLRRIADWNELPRELLQ